MTAREGSFAGRCCKCVTRLLKTSARADFAGQNFDRTRVAQATAQRATCKSAQKNNRAANDLPATIAQDPGNHMQQAYLCVCMRFFFDDRAARRDPFPQMNPCGESKCCRPAFPQSLRQRPRTSACAREVRLHRALHDLCAHVFFTSPHALPRAALKKRPCDPSSSRMRAAVFCPQGRLIRER
jgi:hypothetical protein